MQEVMESRSQWVKKSRRMQAAQLNGAAFYFFTFLLFYLLNFNFLLSSEAAEILNDLLPSLERF